MDQHLVKFDINPSVFADALREVSRGITLTDGNLFICAIDSENSDLYEQQSCVPNSERASVSEERVVLGLEGKEMSYNFVDMPAESVEEPGMFVVGRVDELTKWANVVGSESTVSYQGEGMQNILRIDYPDGHDQIEINLLYQNEDFDNFFGCHLDRFYTPTQSVQDNELANMLALGKRIAPSSERTGDLIFEENKATFNTRQRIGRIVMYGSQSTDLPEEYPLSDFEWEVSEEQLGHLKRIVDKDDSTALVSEEYNERTENHYYSLQFAHNVEASDGSTLFIHHKTTAFRNNPALNDWNDGGEFIHEPSCKLFASVESEKLNRSLDTTWALKPKKVIQAETDNNEDGAPILRLHTYEGDNTNNDEKKIEITPGESRIPHYYFFPDVQKVVKKLIDDSTITQIRSFPISGEERPNAYVILPLPEGNDPSEIPENPDRYCVINWQQQ